MFQGGFRVVSVILLDRTPCRILKRSPSRSQRQEFLGDHVKICQAPTVYGGQRPDLFSHRLERMVDVSKFCSHSQAPCFKAGAMHAVVAL